MTAAFVCICLMVTTFI